MKVQTLILMHRTEWQQGPTLTFFSPHDKKRKSCLWSIRSKKYLPPPKKKPKSNTSPSQNQQDNLKALYQTDRRTLLSPLKERDFILLQHEHFSFSYSPFQTLKQKIKEETITSLYILKVILWKKSFSFNKNELNLKQNARCCVFLSIGGLLFIKKIKRREVRREIIRPSLHLQTENKLVRTITTELASGNHCRQLLFASYYLCAA